MTCKVCDGRGKVGVPFINYGDCYECGGSGADEPKCNHEWVSGNNGYDSWCFCSKCGTHDD